MEYLDDYYSGNDCEGIAEGDVAVAKSTALLIPGNFAKQAELKRTRIADDDPDTVVAEIKRARKAAALEANKILLLARLNSLFGSNQSTSASVTQESANIFAQGTPDSVKNVLAVGSLKLLSPLDEADWETVRGANSFSESAGDHPDTNSIIMAAHRCGTTAFKVLFEKNAVDEEFIVKKFEISLVLADSNSNSKFDLVLPIVVKKKKQSSLSAALSQAMGYTASRLREQVELYGLDESTVLWGYAVGTDGISVAVGVLKIVNLDLKVKYCESGLPLWSTNDTPPVSEPQGFALLRTFLSASPEKLGCRTDGRPFKINSPVPHPVYGAERTLGRGAFCSVLFARAEGGDPVAIKKPTEILGRVHKMCPVAGLQQEMRVLRKFSGSAILPILLDDLQVCDANHAYFFMLPVGISLLNRAADLGSAQQRATECEKLALHMIAALQAAHALEQCHRDIRPANVIYCADTDRYVVIDWGLSAAPATALHHYDGPIPYYSDRLIGALMARKDHFAAVEAAHSDYTMAVNRGEDVKLEDPPPEPLILYHKADDLAAVQYVVYAFRIGQHLLSVPWHKANLEDLVERRKEMIAANVKKVD